MKELIHSFFEWLKNYKSIFEITLIFITIISVIKGLLEYLKQNRIKRKDNFFRLRKELSEKFFPILKNFEDYTEDVKYLSKLNLAKEDGKVKLNIIEKKYDEELSRIPYKLRFTLLDHLEEIALMLNSKFIDKKLTKYMYGWVIEQVWERKGFWEYYNEGSDEKILRHDLKITDWAIVKLLYLKMKNVKTKYIYKRGNLKF